MAIDWVGRGIGGGGLLVAVWTAWGARRDRRRARPMVICEEVQPPEETSQSQLVARVRLINPSDATAYNLRLGLELGGARISWGQEMSNPPRLNELTAKTGTDAQPVLIPPGWAFERTSDPWDERIYWVDYQDAGDWWWTTRNPWQGGQDVRVKLIGGPRRWWLHRQVQTLRQRWAVHRGERAARKALAAGKPPASG